MSFKRRNQKNNKAKASVNTSDSDINQVFSNFKSKPKKNVNIREGGSKNKTAHLSLAWSYTPHMK